MSSTIPPPDFLDKLAPGYREFIQANCPKMPLLHGLTWSPAFRQPPPGGVPDMGAEPPVPVGSQYTIDLGHFSLQVMVPDGEQPNAGWPVVLFLHGGGWVFGNAAMDNGLLSRLCVGAKCVVVSVEYRLAPEHPYPAALDDSWDSLLWLHKNGAEKLAIDPSRIALMGSSAGSNLAAVVAQCASLSSPRIPIKLQVLLVPVIDTSYTAENRSHWTESMIEHENNFALPVLNMLWLRDRYLPNPEDRAGPEASPNYQENSSAFEGVPRTLIVVAELDSLRNDGELYAQKLEKFGVPVTVRVLEGITHMGIRADRVCETARVFRDELIQFIKNDLSYAVLGQCVCASGAMSSDDSSIGSESILSLSESAFSPVDVPVHPFKPPTPPPPAPVNNPADEASSAPGSDPISDDWKDEYDARVANWRAESAEARAKAEAERAKWEELRASGHVPEHETWETVGSEPEAAPSESTGTAVDAPGASISPQAHGSVADEVNAPPVTSVADARDLVSGETSGGNGAEVLGQNTLGYPPSAVSIRTLETSDVDASPVNLSGPEFSANEGGNNTWEELHSVGSSFPSLPDQHNANTIPLQPTYRPRQAVPKKEKDRQHHHRHSHPPAPAPPPSLTLSVFDPALPTRTRVIALFSSLAINMFLPFVNGVMLGFGEIFARNVVGPWFGWPKPIATSVGVRASRDKKRS
ncbi:unnamed protein product [Rhizoctonia solani]|uniref:Alpha/beta hydrolase fold-3 domain-containing protein n=1 Tax=Rhizoctonia solani TaxID=456999 RepID=A0A8H3H0H2_9AGAM|nr:unnamed protein product [Rhizoctonia solani]